MPLTFFSKIFFCKKHLESFPDSQNVFCTSSSVFFIIAHKSIYVYKQSVNRFRHRAAKGGQLGAQEIGHNPPDIYAAIYLPSLDKIGK